MHLYTCHVVQINKADIPNRDWLQQISEFKVYLGPDPPDRRELFRVIFVSLSAHVDEAIFSCFLQCEEKMHVYSFMTRSTGNVPSPRLIFPVEVCQDSFEIFDIPLQKQGKHNTS